MHLLDMLIRNEPISGLDIQDDAIRFVRLEPEKKNRAERIAAAEEVKIPPGTVTDGTLNDVGSFIKALKKLKKKVPKKFRHVVLSIPGDHVYSRIYMFPPSIQGKKLTETMQLTVGFQLPMKADEAYLDWQRIEQDVARNVVLLAAAKRSTLDPFFSVLEKEGFKIVAVEFHALSVTRALKPEHDEVLLLTEPRKEGLRVTAVERGTPWFRRLLSNAHIDKDGLDQELDRIAEFYAAKYGSVAKRTPIDEAPLAAVFSKFKTTKEAPGVWIASVGAAMRGLLPRAQDTMISLTSVGTERAYELQRAVTFAGLFSNLVAGVSAFFVAAFVGAWLFMTSIEQQTLGEIEALNALPTTVVVTDTYEEIQKHNALLMTSGSLLDSFLSWSGVITELSAVVGDDISVTNVSVGTTRGKQALTGIAKNRTAINTLKAAMEQSSSFSDVTSPLGNIGQVDDIPFSVSFQLE